MKYMNQAPLFVNAPTSGWAFCLFCSMLLLNYKSILYLTLTHTEFSCDHCILSALHSTDNPNWKEFAFFESHVQMLKSGVESYWPLTKVRVSQYCEPVSQLVRVDSVLARANGTFLMQYPFLWDMQAHSLKRSYCHSHLTAFMWPHVL